MKVQRVRLPETGHISWLVLDDDYIPIEPILHYLVDCQIKSSFWRRITWLMSTFDTGGEVKM
jgi:hypothetical protein